MKALTVMQPWAQLLISGATRYDFRSWKTTYRGSLLIHAARRFTDAARELCHVKPVRELLAEGGIRFPADLPRAAFLGVITLDDCLFLDELALTQADNEEKAFAALRAGQWVWKMSAPVRLEPPLPHRGALGVFEVSDELMQAELLFRGHEADKP